MKPATFPSLHVAPELRRAAEQVLQEDEFIARGLASRKHARETGGYASADTVLGRLEKMLDLAKSGK